MCLDLLLRAVLLVEIILTYICTDRPSVVTSASNLNFRRLILEPVFLISFEIQLLPGLMNKDLWFLICDFLILEMRDHLHK